MKDVLIKMIGIDVAFANMGFCIAEVNVNLSVVTRILDLILVTTEVEEASKKTVRKNSLDLQRAKQLHQAIQRYTQGCVFACCELPHGAQNARAAWTLGAALGTIASCPIPIIEVSALEVKMATVGKKTATKKEMIAYAETRHPDAPWLRHKHKGVMVLNDSNEHLSDAYSAIRAGLMTIQFQQAKALLGLAPESRRIKLL